MPSLNTLCPCLRPFRRNRRAVDDRSCWACRPAEPSTPARATRYTATHSRQRPRARARTGHKIPRSRNVRECQALSRCPLRLSVLRTAHEVAPCMDLSPVTLAITRPEPSERPYRRCKQLSSLQCLRQARETHWWELATPAGGHPRAGVLGVVVGPCLGLRRKRWRHHTPRRRSSAFQKQKPRRPAGFLELLPDLHFAQVGRLDAFLVLIQRLPRRFSGTSRTWRWCGIRRR